MPFRLHNEDEDTIYADLPELLDNYSANPVMQFDALAQVVHRLVKTLPHHEQVQALSGVLGNYTLVA